jgi:hypothetical protein
MARLDGTRGKLTGADLADYRAVLAIDDDHRGAV